jgi:competence protein ComEC
MAAVLLSPLTPWLLLGLAVALTVGLALRPSPIFLAILLVAFLGGAGRAALAATPTLPSEIAGRAVTVAGIVDDDPVARPGRTRLVVAAEGVTLADGSRFRQLRIQTTIYGRQPPNYGDHVILTGRLDEPARFEQFDYRTYLSDQGISGILQSARLVRVVAGAGDPFHTILFALRHAVVGTVDRVLPEPQAALLLGVVFGYRAALPPALQQQMINSGLIHIVVISGLKVSLLARIIQRSAGRILPRAAPGIALGAMVVYALLAGASAAALRAAAMGGLVVLAGAIRRDTHVFASMAFTGAIMLGLKPALAHDVSFQLSFAGTLGIATLTDPIAHRFQWMPPLLRDPFAATIAAEAATWPLMLADFHQVSMVAPVANALVLPLLPLIMVIGGAGAILGCVVSLAGWPSLQVAGAIASWFRLVIESTASLPMANLTAPYFPSRWLAAAALLNAGGLAGFRMRRFFWRRQVWALMGGAALITTALLLVRPDGRVHVYALEVGNGSAVLVRTGSGDQVLFDCGPNPDRFAQAIGRALPPTARTLRTWIITGGRRDQIGAARAVLDRFDIDRIVVADPDPWTPTLRAVIDQAGRDRIPVETLSGPLQVDGVRLQPVTDQRSWVVRDGNAVVVIAGPDGQTPSPQASPQGGGSSLASVPVIFTQGGPSTWDDPAPALAIVQVDANSRNGLPARAFVQALAGAHLMRTDRLGTVELTSDGSAFVPDS